MRTPPPRAPSNVRTLLNGVTSRRVVRAFDRSRWLSASAGLNPAALTVGLLVLAFVTAMKATRFACKRWKSQGRSPRSFPTFSSLPRAVFSRTELGAAVNLLFLAVLVGGISGWLLVPAPTHELTTFFLAWVVFVCAACFLE